MSERAAFVAAVSADPDDDLPRLVFADWLDEHGDPERAEFIRLQVACFREAEAFPPAIDRAKLARIRELFLANYQTWLGPVYAALGQRLPVFELPTLPAPINFLTRLVRGMQQLAGPVGRRFTQIARERAPGLRLEVDRMHASSTGLSVLHADLVPTSAAVLLRGFLQSLTIGAWHSDLRLQLAAAFPLEPITHLNVALTGSVESWERLDGPHLARVRHIVPSSSHGAGIPRPVADAVFGSPHLSGLTGITLVGAVNPDAGSALFDALRASPLRQQLTRLHLEGVPNLWPALGDPGHGFDAVRDLSVVVGDEVVAEHLTRLGLHSSFRKQLTRLTLTAPGRLGVGWMWAGPEWERLETLWLHGSEFGESWATALSGSEAFPALRVLRVTHANVTEAGAVALARSPLVGRLRALVLDGNPVGDDGAEELAKALDRGLGFLSLVRQDVILSATPPAVAISDATQRKLTTKYGPRIAFTHPAEGG